METGLNISINKTGIISCFQLITASFNAGAGDETRKPTFMFIAVDELRPDIAYFAADHAVTPKIDSLVSWGMSLSAWPGRERWQESVSSGRSIVAVIDVRPVGPVARTIVRTEPCWGS